jgi:membrane protein
VILFVGATGLFSQLKDSLNQVWNVRPREGHAFGKLIRTRLVGFGLVVLMGMAMITLLGVSTFVAGAAKAIEGTIAVPGWVVQIVDLLVSMGIISTLLTVLYRYLPDAKIAWKDAWVGAGITAVLLAVGKVGLGIYLGKSSVASVYGAAGSLVIALVWIYYSSALLLFGAELTQCYAEMYGHRIEPADWAEPVNKAPADDRKPEKVWRQRYKDDAKPWNEIADEYRGKGRCKPAVEGAGPEAEPKQR